MTDPKDPPRLLDATGGAPQGLRDVLTAAQKDVGSEAQLARLAARLGPLLGPPVAPAPPAASGVGAAVKLGLAGVALLVAGGGAWLLSAPKSAPPSAPISTHLAPAPPAPVSSPEPAAPSGLPEAPALEPASPGASSIEAPGPTRPPPARPGQVAQLSEAELLEQARSALRSDPARALARANEHRSRFPGGALIQEREVIAIKALRQLGRVPEADRRAEAFEKAFPGSAFQRKLKPSP
jgi:hypothetical protein